MLPEAVLVDLSAKRNDAQRLEYPVKCLYLEWSALRDKPGGETYKAWNCGGVGGETAMDRNVLRTKQCAEPIGGVIREEDIVDFVNEVDQVSGARAPPLQRQLVACDNG